MPAVFVLIWSTGFIVAKYGLPYAPPLTFLAIRYFLSIVCFLVWIALARAAWPQSRQQWLHLAVTGVLMHAGYLGGVWVAVKVGMGSGLTALIVGLQPVLTALWVSWVQQAPMDRTGAGPGRPVAGGVAQIWHRHGGHGADAGVHRVCPV
jgi:drug/metabolite transporter (DMT)-like permease